MGEYKNYRKKHTQLLRPYVPGEDLSDVSVSATDTPELGGMIAINPDNTDDKWYVAKKFFEDNYVLDEEPSVSKTLCNSDVNGAKKNVPDLETYGDGDTFKLICKASSQNEGWMKSTKAMQVPNGCVVQVTTQQRNPDGSYSVAEALCFVPDVCIQQDTKGVRRLVRQLR